MVSVGDRPRGTFEGPRRKKLSHLELSTQLLAKLDRAFQTARPSDEAALSAIYPVLEQELGVDAVLAYKVSEHAMQLTFSRGLDNTLIHFLERLDFGQAICGSVAATGKPIYISDVQRSMDPRADLVRSIGVAAVVSEPVQVDGRLLGTLSFGSRNRTSFAPQELILFRNIAARLARQRLSRSA